MFVPGFGLLFYSFRHLFAFILLFSYLSPWFVLFATRRYLGPSVLMVALPRRFAVYSPFPIFFVSGISLGFLLRSNFNQSKVSVAKLPRQCDWEGKPASWAGPLPSVDLLSFQRCQLLLEIRDSQNLAKLGLGGQLIRSDVFCLCSVVF